MEDEDGYFYYINTSSLTRTRYFKIVIDDLEDVNEDWGLTDNNNSWDK